MLLVLFAVVLILPAFQVEGERHRRAPDPCFSSFYGGADIWCALNGYGGFQGYDPSDCTLRCKYGTSNLPLPATVCRTGSPPCKTDTKDAVIDWKEEMEKRKKNLTEIWCTRCKCR